MIIRRLFGGHSAKAQEVERARNMLQADQLDAAMRIARQLMASDPDEYEYICLTAEVCVKQGNLTGAYDLYSRAVRLDPRRPIGHYKRANLDRDLGRLNDAVNGYSEAIALKPDYVHAYCNRGVVLQRLGRGQESLASFDSAVRLDPSDPLVLFNRGSVLAQLHRQEDALESYELALTVKPDYAECHCNLGLLRANLGQVDAALESYRRCLEINPAFSSARFNQGVLLQAEKRLDKALDCYSELLEREPGHTDALANRAAVKLELGALQGAAMDAQQAVNARPDAPEYWLIFAGVLARLAQFEAVVEACDRALALKSNDAEALYIRADALLQLKEFGAAKESYDLAARGGAGRAYLEGMRLYAKLNICEWAAIESETATLVRTLGTDPKASPPFPLLTFIDEPQLQLNCARSWAVERCQTPGPVKPSLYGGKRSKIRVGYFSGDFHAHPVSMLLAPVIEQHDRSNFEVVGFSYGPDTKDDVRRRMGDAFDRFIDVGGSADRDIASMANDMQLDIAVDLAGYTGNGRTKIFSWRAAPLQLNFLGYPGSMGAQFMDYLVADDVAIPNAQRIHYSEKIISLPTSFLPMDCFCDISDVRQVRSQFGLPAGAFVFCCFNNSYKMNPEMFDVWMRILRSVPDSVLWLSRQSEIAVRNIRHETSKRGIEPDRVIFAERLVSHAEHLARHRHADLFLDTFPYNAHATAVDSLLSGLPIVTLAGRGLASRVGASLLTACGLEDHIVSSPIEYEELALELAFDAGRLASARERLSRARTAGSSFDTHRFVKQLEAAYAAIVERRDSGLPPDHVPVQQDA